MRAARIAAALVACLLLAAPALGASFSTGNYAGKTKQKRKISFHADFSTGELTAIKFVETGRCRDGTTTKGKQRDLVASVDANGNFKIAAKSDSGGTRLTLKGKIAGQKAKGYFVVKSRYRKNDTKPSPNGKIKCSTGKVKWSAKLHG